MQALEYLAHPLRGLGPLRFGMSRTEVCAVLGAPDSTFRRDRSSESETDVFDRLGIYVCYGTDGKCEAIELTAPSNIVLAGGLLIGRPFEDVVRELRQLDPNVEVDESGATAHSVGIGIYAPHAAKAPSLPVESAIAFSSGYYD